ncbi:MAG: hypothetical protein HC859_02720 [Bacteroidia bacterium]|nr:hypothetical protein [Bacteroidia bacterium]
MAIKTYDTPADMKDSESFQEVLYDKKIGLGSATRSYYQYSAPTLNVVFLNSRLEPTGTLLDKKGFIDEFRYPEKQDHYAAGDTSVLKYITYEIGFEDSNKDGVMNSDDKTDLYFTDLEGKNLTQITHALDVHRYYFFSENELIIIYARRSDKPEEYKKEHFARYDFRTRKLEDLQALHQTLDQLEKIFDSMTFRDIPGLNDTKSMLTDAVKNQHMAHAQLFVGAEGALNLPMAIAYATYLHCETKATTPAARARRALKISNTFTPTRTSCFR